MEKRNLRRPMILRTTAPILNQLINDLTNGHGGSLLSPLHGDALPRDIKIDVAESANEYVVHAEIPGASKENIHVDIDGSVIGIKASISQLDRKEDEKSLKSERYYGEVSRSFQLASEVDEQQSKAKYENGVLTLTLAKKAKVSGQRLAID